MRFKGLAKLVCRLSLDLSYVISPSLQCNPVSSYRPSKSKVGATESLPCYSHTGIHFQALHSQQHRSSSTGPTYPTKHSHIQQAYMGQKFTSTVTLIKAYTQNQYRAQTSEHKQKHPQSGCTSHADRKHLQQVNTHCPCDQTQNSRTQTRRQFQKQGQI